jgi:hypothetical protein
MARHGWTAPENEKIMADFYGQSRGKLGDLTGDKLVGNMEWRLYTEWCCNRGESRGKFHGSYKGEAFEKWIRDETHYAIEGEGFKWNPEQQRFDGNDNFAQVYEQKRERVLQASVKRAVEFFGKCKEHQWPYEGDARNLRVSLKPYM